MATYEAPRNLMVECPYDPTHIVPESRLQLHMTKCGKRRQGIKINTCKFNAQHKVEPGKMELHLLECEDRNSAPRNLRDDSQNESVPKKKMRNGSR